jgi:hypothetical protein
MDELAGSGMRIWTDDERLPELLASVLGGAPNGPELAAGGTR